MTVPTYAVDLHNHTPLLTHDYRGSLATTPHQIVEAALAAGLDVYGATDHFSVDFCQRLEEAADEIAEQTGRRLLIVSGAELKVRHGEDEVHIIALLPPKSATRSFSQLAEILELSTPVAPVSELHRVTVAHPPCEVYKAIEALGGIGMVGHIDREFGRYRLLDSPHADRLLSLEDVHVVEVVDPRHAEAFRGYDIAVVSSSDSHSLEEIGRRYSRLEMADLSFSALRTALTAPVALPV
ncbi:MAG: hypothetical protein JXE06_10410 [Coriobacteriia bacterium]|nr:hypothetical protein [Coriobacteriia bacterium]MBN2822382.1 hypothetical protein [Coriobacteriia bacterium]